MKPQAQCWLAWQTGSFAPQNHSWPAVLPVVPGVQWFYSFVSIQCEIQTNLSDERALHAVKYLHAYSNRSTGV